MKDYFKRTKMLDETKIAAKRNSLFLDILLFYGVNIASSFIQVFAMIPAFFHYFNTDKKIIEIINSAVQTGKDDSQKLLDRMVDMILNIPDWLFIVSLFSILIVIATVLFYCLKFEKRTLSNLGFRGRFAMLEYLAGLVIGAILICAIFGICVALGVFKIKDVTAPSVPVIVLYFIGYAIRGFSQTLLIHGYFMTSLCKNTNTFSALLLSSTVFAVFYHPGADISIISFINLFMFSIILGVLMLKRGNIWMISAIHGVWGFVENKLFGLSIGGTDNSFGIITLEVADGRNTVTGGSLGVMGGLIATLVLFLALGAVLVMKYNESELSDMKFPEEEEKENA